MAVRYAFVSLVTSDSYLPGALAVAAALREVHPVPPVDPEVPFQSVCLVTPETIDVKTIKHLRRAFDLVVGVEVIEEQLTPELRLLGRPDLRAALTKLHVFRLTQFEKIIYLDADVLPTRPLSHLFTLPHEFSAVPDVGWPDIFNSGMMVLSPGEDKFQEIMGIVKNKGSWDGADQGVLNEWRGSNWNRLSFTYNVTPTAAYSYAPAYERFGSQISALHFIGTNKPWNELPYRAPSSSASQRPQSQLSSLQSGPQQLSLTQQVFSTDHTHNSMTANLLPSGNASTNQSYAYDSLVDRWFDVYDRNYRQIVPATEAEYETRKYTNAWNDNAPSTQKNISGDALGLEELRRLTLQGGSSVSRQDGEGDYRSLPLEGRIDLMRPRADGLFRELSLPRSDAQKETSIPSEEHVRTPTINQPQWQGQPSDQSPLVFSLGTTEVPPSPHLAPLPLPLSAPTSATPELHDLSERQPIPTQSLSQSLEENSNLRDVSGTQASQTHMLQTHSGDTPSPPQQSQHHQSQPSGEPRRPISPPLLSWNPAIEPPPNVPPTPSAFPTDAYFPNAWDIPPSSSSGKLHAALTGSTSISSQLFELPPHTQIPPHLIQEGHYRNVTGPEHDKSPQPDISKVTSIFPWERKPRHVPGRVFPEGESMPPGVQYIENMPPTEPEQDSELSTPEMTQEEKVHIGSPQIQLPSPPIGFPGARGYSNAWDSVPSIQKYAARLAKPSVTSPPLAFPVPRVRRRSDSYRSRGDQSDANSMDGDVEDEVDDDESDVNAGGRFSSSERSDGERSRTGSKGSLASPPSGSIRSRTGKKDYRSYGVQTVPKDVRSVAVQVSEDIPTSTGKLNIKNVPISISTATPGAGRPHLELPKQPPLQELVLGPEPTALATPSSANVDAFIRSTTSGRQQLQGTSAGMISPRLHDVYIFGSPTRTPVNASPGSQTPVTRRQTDLLKSASLNTEQSQSLTHPVARTSSQETADSPVGPASPMDSPPATHGRKMAGRKWNPATGLDVFKRGSEEVLARFLRLGSWEDESQSPAHSHSQAI